MKNPSPKKDTGIRLRILKGIGAQSLSQIIQIFIRIVEVPLLLSFWGMQLYGEWLMLSAIPAYLSIGDGGFTTAACREMTIRGGAGDKLGIQKVFQTTWLLLIAFSILGGFFAYGFVQVAPLEHWLGFSAIKGSEIKIIFLLLVSHVIVSFQGGLLSGGYWVTGRYSSCMYLNAITQALEFGGLTTAVSLGGGPVQAAFGYLFGRLLGTVLMWIGQLQVSPWLRHGLAHASLSELKQLTAPAFASLAFPLGSAFNIQGMRLIIGLVLGPPAVALFVPLRTLSRIALQPGSIINRLSEPELALAYGARNNKLFRNIFSQSCQLALWGCLGVCLIIGPGAYWIFPAWTGSIIAMDWFTYLLLLAVILVNSTWYTALMVPCAINCHGRIALFYAFVYGVITLGIGYILSIKLSIAGVALALLMAESAMTVIVIRASLRIVRMSFIQWAKTIIQPPFSFIRKTQH